MRISRFIAALAAGFVLVSCATSTPYQNATKSSYGYSDQQIESNRWMVSFSGNSLTNRKTVETYLLYRAAELTLQQGFDHFRVVQRETDSEKRYVATGFASDPFYTYFPAYYSFYGRHGRLRGYPRGFYRSGFGYHDPFWGDSYDYREVVRYEATSEIIMGKGEKPDDPAFFDARDVEMNLAPTIVRPEP